MNDLISRQAAIDALDGKINITGRENAETIRDYINGVNKKLRELPSAERHGKWEPIVIGGEVWGTQCSKCHAIDLYGKTAYCPNCVARMDGGENG